VYPENMADLLRQVVGARPGGAAASTGAS